jgi:hypothetical protein
MAATLTEPMTRDEQYVIEWEFKVKDYQLIVGRTPKGFYHPYILKEDMFLMSFGAMKELADARRAVKAWYHTEEQDLSPGGICQVARDLLEPIPVNRRVYYAGELGETRHAEDVTEMVKALGSESSYLSTLLVDELGGIVSGEIRWQALGDESLRERYIDLNVEVKTYPTQWEKIQALVLENRSKKRTKEQVEAEQLAVYAAEKELAKWRMAHSRLLGGEVSRSTAAVAAAKKLNDAGIEVSPNKLKRISYVNGLISRLKDKDLQKKLKIIATKSPEAAYSVFKEVDDADRSAVVEEMVNEGNFGSGRGKKSVKAIYAEVKARDLQSSAADSGLKSLYEIAKGKDDDPENNRLTPGPIIELVEDLYGGEIDVDVFAELEKANIPAKKHISIIEDAFATDWCLDDGSPAKIFANIPWKIPSDSIKRLRSQIQEGHVSEAVVIASNTILHAADCLAFIEDFSPVILPWRRGNGTKRLDFKPGSYLLYCKPEAVSGNSNKDVVFLYYGEQQQRFQELFSMHGLPLLTEQAAANRVYSFWDNLLDRWKDGQPVEVKGIVLDVRPTENGLWAVWADQEQVRGMDCAVSETEAKCWAIAYAIQCQPTFMV